MKAHRDSYDDDFDVDLDFDFDLNDDVYHGYYIDDDDGTADHSGADYDGSDNDGPDHDINLVIYHIINDDDDDAESRASAYRCFRHHTLADLGA